MNSCPSWATVLSDARWRHIVWKVAEIIYRLLSKRKKWWCCNVLIQRKVHKKGKLLGTVAFSGLGGQGYFEEFTNPKMSSHQNCGRLVMSTRGGYVSVGSFGSKDTVNAKFNGSCSCRQLPTPKNAHNRARRRCIIRKYNAFNGSRKATSTPFSKHPHHINAKSRYQPQTAPGMNQSTASSRVCSAFAACMWCLTLATAKNYAGHI